MRRVLITGATGGIGGAIVRQLAGRGDELTCFGGDPVRLRRLQEELPAVRTVEADLRRPEYLAEAAAGIDALDVLVHCAGVADVAAVADMPYATWHETLTVNVAAAAELTRVLLPALRRERGHVVFVNAAPGTRAVPSWSAFAGSKAALRELADSLREEEDGNGVRVTTVYPGGTAGDRLRRIRELFGRPYDPDVLMNPDSLARVVGMVLDAPADVQIVELSCVRAPRR